MSRQTLEEFVRDRRRDDLGLGSAVVEYAALQRGLHVERIDRITLFVRLPAGITPFVGLNGPDTSQLARTLCAYQDGRASLLQDRGIPVPRSAMFPASQVDQAIGFADDLGWPVNVQPGRPARRAGLTISARSKQEFRTAWERARKAPGAVKGERRILVEEHVGGEEFRFFVVDGHVVSAVWLARANVVGDGHATVSELITQKNSTRSANPYASMNRIRDDKGLGDYLSSVGRSVTYVPGDGERVDLQSRPDIKGGADIVDVTEEADTRYTRLAVEAVNAIPSLAYAAVDLVAPAVTSNEADPGRHVVTGVDCSPSPLAHFPTRGSARDLAGAIVEHYAAAPRWQVAHQAAHRSGSGRGLAPGWRGPVAADGLATEAASEPAFKS